MIKLLLVVNCVLILSGCSFNSQPDQGQAGQLQSSSMATSRIFQDPDYTYAVTIPQELSRWTTYSQGMNDPSYPSFTKPLDQADQVRATIYSLASTCSPSLTGVSQTIQIADVGTKAEWGRVDGWDHLNTESGDNPYDALRDVVCTPYGLSYTPTIYALCSEKNEKTVVICISQMTDNPELAKEIFESFRWND